MYYYLNSQILSVIQGKGVYQFVDKYGANVDGYRYCYIYDLLSINYISCRSLYICMYCVCMCVFIYCCKAEHNVHTQLELNKYINKQYNIYWENENLIPCQHILSISTKCLIAVQSTTPMTGLQVVTSMLVVRNFYISKQQFLNP